MQRLSCTPRANWQATVESQGFHFHSADDRPYWDESACYLFDGDEVDELEAATYELNELCLRAVDHVIERNLFHLFQIPPEVVPWVVQSWERDEFTLYGRFDLAYNGEDEPKLLEFNADTPTSLLEAAAIQWFWFKDVERNPDAYLRAAGTPPPLPTSDPFNTLSPGQAAAAYLNPQASGMGRGSYDQFNSIHERLLEAWRAYGQIIADRRAAAGAMFNPTMYFTAVGGNLEDFMTVTYLRDTALQAGLATEYVDVERVGFDHNRGLFVDVQNRPIHNCFKLYPWEWMIREQFGPMLPRTLVHWLESPWKMILSNKAILPILHDMFPGHPNLLPASFNPIPGPHVRKPILSREGANVSMVINNRPVIETPGPYGGGPFVYQQLQPLPDFQGNQPVIGSWLVNGHACGVGIREDSGPITGNLSRFVPHLFTRE